MMEAYLDNSATTRCGTRVFEKMQKVLLEDYGNPSSLHRMGVIAENYVKDARKKIAATLKAQEKEIIFTSGGTESNNLAILGAAFANRRAGNHIITTQIEHASVANPMKYLEEMGYEVTYLPVDEYGRIRLSDFQAALTDQTILVSLMQVNNEIGAVEPVAEAAALAHEKNPGIVVHVDAIQSYGKYRICPKREQIDLLSVSGHKIHGPKGTGFLYIRENTKIKPILYGGGQQGGMRSGTENVPGIVGLGEAAEEIYENFSEKQEKLYQRKEQFVQEISLIEGVSVNGKTGRESAPHIVSVSVDGVRAEVLLHALEEQQIYVSSGSACASNKPSVSRTLKAIGLKGDLLDATVRFSFSVHTTEEEISYAAETLKMLLPKLRRYTRH